LSKTGGCIHSRSFGQGADFAAYLRGRALIRVLDRDAHRQSVVLRHSNLQKKKWLELKFHRNRVWADRGRHFARLIARAAPQFVARVS
jgi:hypothetical protein